MVRKRAHIPDRGDIVWVDFSPQKGHEQAHRRPAIVLSPRFYNKKSGLCLVCPITSKRKGYEFEVLIEHKKIKGVVLTDQIRSMDWHVRNITFIQKIGPAILAEIKESIIQLLTEN